MSAHRLLHPSPSLSYGAYPAPQSPSPIPCFCRQPSLLPPVVAEPRKRSRNPPRLSTVVADLQTSPLNRARAPSSPLHPQPAPNVHLEKAQCCTVLRFSQNGHFFPERMVASDEKASPPPRPKRIILVRHGQSEGNVDENAYTRTPDSKVPLTEEGWKQAIQCGKKIRKLLESEDVDEWQVYFYVSPYKRTLQTLRGMGLAFERERIAGVREEPRLREQDFGNFQDREKMRVEKEVRLRYGRFFYRFPNGESAADVYDRITGFRETLRADIDIGRFQRPESRSKDVNLVIVSHGLTLRVFLMRWYKWSVQQFEGLRNFGNTGMLVMQLGSGGRYSLLVHHSHKELKAFGLTDEMLMDQEWQMVARKGELNYDWMTSGPSFFSHFDAKEEGIDLEATPLDVVCSVQNDDGIIQQEPPVGWPS